MLLLLLVGCRTRTSSEIVSEVSARHNLGQSTEQTLVGGLPTDQHCGPEGWSGGTHIVNIEQPQIRKGSSLGKF